MRPDCRAHTHISLREAAEWTRSEYGPERRTPRGNYVARSQARWVGVGGRYLVLEAVRRWMAYRGVLQLLPFAAPLGTNRMPSRSNGKPGVMVMPSKSQQLIEKSRVDAITHR